MAKEVVINNSKLNSFKFRILTSGIDITQYQRNPILLWMHQRASGETKEILPIGRIDNLRVDGDNLIGTPVFDESDEFAKKIKAKWDSGFLKMVSPGLDPIETSTDPALVVEGQKRATVTKSKLIEVSIVDIGANDDALILYREGKILNLASGADSLIIPEIQLQNNLNNQKNENEMKTIALKLGLPETATEAEVLTKIGALQLSAQNADTLQKEVEKQRDKAIETEVDSAIKLKRITADKREHFITLGKSAGIDNLKTTLELMSPAVKPMDVIVPGASAATSGDYKKWEEVPADKRIELRKSDPGMYKALYKAEYGFEPKIEV
ncbi:MAG: HK97 family phage prohead protease [Dysgonamonadaceae bacterium]|jgi:hypothetical protein|nr:HK97 family phage prohead protease [Dysgonamonadaceae bacterium]